MKKSLFSLILVSLILAVYSQKSSCNSSLTTVPSINKFNELPTSTNTQTKERIQLSQSQVEVVASNTATGDGGNAWGGHQTRIVNTKDGVFTAYTTGDEYFNRN